MNKEQTALDYFLQELRIKYPMIDLDFKRQINKAEAINYEQYIQAYSTGWHDGQEVIMKKVNAIKNDNEKGEIFADIYYHEKYVD